MSQDNFRKQSDRLLEQLTRLAESGLPTEKFYVEFVRHLHNEMNAVASAIWRLTKAGRFILETQIDLLQATLELDHARVVDRQNTLRRVIERGEPTLVKPSADSSGGKHSASVLLAPVLRQRKVVGLLEVWVRADCDPGDQRDMLHFLGVVADLCASGGQEATVSLEDRRKHWNRLSQGELEQSRKHINRLLEEIARLSESELPPDDFYAQFLSHLHNSITAAASAIWLAPQPGALSLQTHINLPQAELEDDDPRRASHDQLLRQVAGQAKPMIVSPQHSESPNAATYYSDYTFLVAPILVEKQVAGLVEVWVSAQRHPDAQRGFLQFLVIAADLCAGFIRNHQSKG